MPPDRIDGPINRFAARSIAPPEGLRIRPVQPSGPGPTGTPAKRVLILPDVRIVVGGRGGLGLETLMAYRVDDEGNAVANRINGVVNTKVSMDGKAIAMRCRTFFGSGSYVYGRKRDWRQSEVHIHNRIRL